MEVKIEAKITVNDEVVMEEEVLVSNGDKEVIESAVAHAHAVLSAKCIEVIHASIQSAEI